MRSMMGFSGYYRIAAAMALCLGGCQPAASDKPISTISVPTNEVSAPADEPAVSGTTAKPAEGAVENEENGPKIAVEVKTLADALKEIAAEKGKWTVVDVWSTSCIPCMREFPHLVELAKKYPDKVRCVSINVDYVGLKSKTPESYVPAVEEFLKKQKAEFKNYLSATPDSDVFTELEIESIPAIVVLGPDGEKKKTFTDDNSGDDGITYEGDVIPWLESQLK